MTGQTLYSIFGNGFIGKALGKRLNEMGHDVQIISRGTWPKSESHLGRVIFTSGMTSDFRKFPLETTDAHVGYLSGALRAFTFDSFVYLSSTRLYVNCETTSEDTHIPININDRNDIFTASKLCAEMLLLSQNNPVIRIARPSNVYGLEDRSNNFLTSLINDREAGNQVVIRSSPRSSKDYIHIDDVVAGLIALATREITTHQVYNLASSRNISNAEIAIIFEKNGTPVAFQNEDLDLSFPKIDTTRLTREFGPINTKFEDVVESILKERS